jgi:hypothetical protein
MGKPCPPARPWTTSGTGSEQDVSVSRAPSRRDDASQPQRVGGPVQHGKQRRLGTLVGPAPSLAARRGPCRQATIADWSPTRVGGRSASTAAERKAGMKQMTSGTPALTGQRICLGAVVGSRCLLDPLRDTAIR